MRFYPIQQYFNPLQFQDIQEFQKIILSHETCLNFSCHGIQTPAKNEALLLSKIYKHNL